MEILIDKIAQMLMPNNFAKILPYCFWYWLVLTGIFYWLMKGRK
jgi:hypothetical protein